MLTTSNTATTISILDEGVYEAVCTQIIDLGKQFDETFGKSSYKIMIVWEVLGQTITIGDTEYPRQVNKMFTNSLSEKSNLRKTLQAWRGRAFTADELKSFDLTKLIGSGAQLQILHKSGRKGTYAAVETVIPTAGKKRLKVDGTIFDLDDPDTYGVFQSLPGYVQQIISKAENFAYTGLSVESGGKGPDEGAPSDSDAPPVCNSTADGFMDIPDENGDLPF